MTLYVSLPILNLIILLLIAESKVGINFREPKMRFYFIYLRCNPDLWEFFNLFNLLMALNGIKNRYVVVNNPLP